LRGQDIFPRKPRNARNTTPPLDFNSWIYDIYIAVPLYKIALCENTRPGSIMPDATVTHTAAPPGRIVLPARALSFGAVRLAI